MRGSIPTLGVEPGSGPRSEVLREPFVPHGEKAKAVSDRGAPWTENRRLDARGLAVASSKNLI